MSEQRIPLRIAERMVADVRNALAATCSKIEIAGSVRRRSPDVKDAEIVAIPSNATFALMENMVAAGAWTKALYGADRSTRWGMKYRGIDVRHYNSARDLYDQLRVELFMTELNSWGFQLALRTGPGEANKRLMTWMQKTPLRCIDGAVWYAEDWQREGDEWVSESKYRAIVRSEEAWFGLFGMRFVPPEARRADLYDAAKFTPQAMALLPAQPRQTSMFD